ncbi:MAG: class I SAM-dependent methyltransferase [Nitrospirae bacterium]|nr:class I SAM-dependent methyltransferase [Nitrospirota bacterium]
MKYGNVCPVCRSRYGRRIFSSPYPLPAAKTLNRLDYEICFLCGVIYPSNKPSVQQLHLYYKYHPDLNEPNHVKRGDRVLSFLKRNIEMRNKKILDIGCGDGYLLGQMRRESGYLYGIEPNDKRRKSCSELVKDAVVSESLSEIDPDMKFDLIVMTDVMEHLLEPQAILSRTKKMLAPNGFFYVDIPDVSGKGFISDLFFPHIHHFSKDNFQLFLRRNGFNINDSDNYDMGTTFLRMFFCAAEDKNSGKLVVPAASARSAACRIEMNVMKKLEGLDRFLNAALLKLEQSLFQRKGAALVIYPCGLQIQMLLQKFFSKLPENVFLIDRNSVLQDKSISGVSVKPPEVLPSIVDDGAFILFASGDMNTNKALMEYVKSICREKFESDCLFFNGKATAALRQ